MMSQPGISVATTYISVHVPKTGGTTFRAVLAAHFGDALSLFYRKLVNAQMEPLAGFPPAVGCIHGHFPARTYDAHFPQSRRIAWLRHPVERVISEYEHHRRRTDPYNKLSLFVADGASLAEFAAHPAARNTQSRMRDGLPLTAFAFVGISEHFDKELARFAQAVTIELPAGRWSNVNPGKPATMQYELPQQTYEYIAGANAGDFALYRQVC